MKFIPSIFLSSYLLLGCFRVGFAKADDFEESRHVESVRGLSPEYLDAFKGDFVTCDSGSRSFPRSRLNDDYCDCADGSDEPGTSACSNGRFYCLNSGHLPGFIPSSRVDDGICDGEECCDGSDEPEGSCPNLCPELHQRVLKEQREAERLLKEGERVKKDYLNFGVTAAEERKVSVGALEQKVNSQSLLIETLEREFKRAEEAVKIANLGPGGLELRQKLSQAKGDMLKHQESIKGVESAVETLRAVIQSEPPTDYDGLKSAVTAFMDSWNVYNISSFHQISLLADESVAPAEPEADPDAESEPDAEAETSKNSDNSTSTSGLVGFVMDHAQNVFSNVNGYYMKCGTPLVDHVLSWTVGSPIRSDRDRLQNQADNVKSQLENARSGLRDLESKLSTAREKNGRNYGPGLIFAKMDGECFKFSNAEYIYEICPYGEAKQNSPDGNLVANLGSWEPWPESVTDFSQWRFVDGAKCWNGPARSMTVSVKCGPENKILAVSEPNKCEYQMEMQSPTLC